MMLQERPSIAEEERHKVSIGNIGPHQTDGRCVRRQSFETRFGKSEAYKRMCEVIHAELSEETKRRGRWRQLRVTRRVDFQKLLCGFTRCRGFRNRLSVFVSRLARCVDYVIENVGSLFFLSLFVVNGGQSQIRCVWRYDGRVCLRSFAVQTSCLAQIAISLFCLGQGELCQDRAFAASLAEILQVSFGFQAIGYELVSRNEVARFRPVRFAVFCRYLFKLLNCAFGTFLLARENRILCTRWRHGIDVCAVNGDGSAHRSLGLFGVFVPPTNKSVNANGDYYDGN